MSFQYPECSVTYIITGTTTNIYPQGTGQTAATAARTILHTLVFGNTLAGTVTVKDGTLTKAVFAIGTVAQSITFDASFASGITIVTTAADNVTVNWTL